MKYLVRTYCVHASPPVLQGESANRVLMVKDGEAVAVGLTDTDEEVELRIYEPLDFFGDITKAKSRSHTASVKAQTDCTVSLTNKPHWHRIVGE